MNSVALDRILNRDPFLGPWRTWRTSAQRWILKWATMFLFDGQLPNDTSPIPAYSSCQWLRAGNIIGKSAPLTLCSRFFIRLTRLVSDRASFSETATAGSRTVRRALRPPCCYAAWGTIPPAYGVSCHLKSPPVRPGHAPSARCISMARDIADRGCASR